MRSAEYKPKLLILVLASSLAKNSSPLHAPLSLKLYALLPSSPSQLVSQVKAAKSCQENAFTRLLLSLLQREVQVHVLQDLKLSFSFLCSSCVSLGWQHYCFYGIFIDLTFHIFTFIYDLPRWLAALGC